MTIKHPEKIGMRYEQAKKTAIRHAKEGSVRTVDSMVNQVRLCEGERAAKEFKQEVFSKSKEQRGKKYF